jgi:hypothetical protein
LINFEADNDEADDEQDDDDEADDDDERHPWWGPPERGIDDSCAGYIYEGMQSKRIALAPVFHDAF